MKDDKILKKLNKVSPNKGVGGGIRGSREAKSDTSLAGRRTFDTMSFGHNPFEEPKAKSYLPFFLLGLVILLVSGLIYVLVYLNTYYKADDLARAALISDENILVDETDFGVSFLPKSGIGDFGFIFYPGGKVEHEAYSLLAKGLAEEGIVSCIVKMPFRLAVLKPEAAKEVFAEYKSVKHWYLGGHSLGGAMVAQYIDKNPELHNVEGLIFLAAYATKDIKGSQLPVLSIYGTMDQVLNMKNYEEGKQFLPEGYVELILEGANHGQFGNYGFQKGDGFPGISAQQQMDMTIDAIVDFIKK